MLEASEMAPETHRGLDNSSKSDKVDGINKQLDIDEKGCLLLELHIEENVKTEWIEGKEASSGIEEHRGLDIDQPNEEKSIVDETNPSLLLPIPVSKTGISRFFDQKIRRTSEKTRENEQCLHSGDEADSKERGSKKKKPYIDRESTAEVCIAIVQHQLSLKSKYIHQNDNTDKVGFLQSDLCWETIFGTLLYKGGFGIN